jgi:arginyl-tRNA synthetase
MTTARVVRLAGEGKLDINALTLDDLDRAYAAAQRECQRDVQGLEAARAWSMGPKVIAELQAQVDGATESFAAAREMLLRLQRGEASATAVWKKIYEVTMRECLHVCDLLGVAVTGEHTAGESSYAQELAPMVQDLLERNVAQTDQGAVIVRLDTPPTGPRGEREEPIKEPCLIRKSDGGFLYATTDVCAVRRRVQKLGADRIVYAIDARQNLHLRQVFLASKLAGYATTRAGAWVRCEHAAFGMILGHDGKPFKTRTGDNVKLADLIEETFERSRAALGARAVGLSEEEARATARAVGIAALKYADLSTDRVKDSLFSFDKMLAFEGNTGPYLLYALVRIKNIFRKAAAENAGGAWKDAGFSTQHPTEKQLALVLLRYGRALASAAEAVEPHRLCNYLYELAGAFASFYDKCPVLSEQGATRDGRLRLCHLTARVLEDGLHCLGIPPAERM